LEAATRVKGKLRDNWQTQRLGDPTSKLQAVRGEPGNKISHYNLNRGQQVIITRLRTGQSDLTHSQLLAKETPAACNTCHTYTRVTTKHGLTDSRKSSATRQKYEIPDISKQHLTTASAD
jgi:hypothetical protein